MGDINRRVQRMLHKENGEIINAEMELKRKYDKIFGGGIAETIFGASLIICSKIQEN